MLLLSKIWGASYSCSKSRHGVHSINDNNNNNNNNYYYYYSTWNFSLFGNLNNLLIFPETQYFGLSTALFKPIKFLFKANCTHIVVWPIVSFLTAVFYFVGNSEMVSVMLEAGCHKNAKMGIPGTITPLNLATELGLKDIICQLS